MANLDKIRVIYHPASKIVDFELFDNGELVNDRYEELIKYSEKQRGSFVLQLCGSEFCEDISSLFPSKDEVPVEMVSTEEDYEDFKQMVEMYNKNKDEYEYGTKIELQPLNEKLPDMNEQFEEIKAQAEKVISLLEKSHDEIMQINPAKAKEDSISYRDEQASKIREFADKIKDSLMELSDNSVNLCFVGAYSSGKSSLINALLGYKILPVSINPETAKMVIIENVLEFDKVYVKFQYMQDSDENITDGLIRWDRVGNNLHFDESATNLETNLKKEIEDLLINNRPCHKICVNGKV